MMNIECERCGIEELGILDEKRCLCVWCYATLNRRPEKAKEQGFGPVFEKIPEP